MSARAWLRSAVAGVVGVVAVGARPPSVASAAGGAGVHYSFDTADRGGLRVVGRNGGAVRTVPGVSGTAVAFPPACGGSCPRAILEGRDDNALDPGSRPIRYGASVLLRTEQTADGSNVVQKGVWSSSSQWKLQVDGHGGRPSCALMGTGSRRLYLVVAPVPVADGRWHQVTCVRSGAVLRIEVDGAARGQVAVPAGLSVANSAPLRIGGNGVSASSDRFHGTVDDVFVTVG
jgi:hypothetical protein